MSLPMLVVDSDIEVSKREQAASEKQGIFTVRVDTMQEAIEKLNKEDYLFTAINADNVNYLPLLRIMRDVSPTPIFIITSNFKMYDQVEALHNGADGYAPFQTNSDENIQSALALLHRYHERDRQRKKSIKIISHENLFVFPAFRQVFRGDKEIVLTKIEFDLLCFLMKSRRLVFTFEQIYRNVWGDEYLEKSKNVLWCQVRDLRRKLNAAGAKNYIKTIKDVGYSFDPR